MPTVLQLDVKFMSRGRSATKTESVQGAIKDLTRFLKKVETVPILELQKSKRTILAEAIARTPYKTGKLERSVYVIVSSDRRRPGLRAGASALSKKGYNYAGIQHENEDFEHPIKGTDHFISDPFNAEIQDLAQRIERKMTW